MQAGIGLWVLFNLLIVLLLALDLGIFHRRAHAVRFREAAVWSTVWIVLSLLFNAGVYLYAGPRLALEFLTAYLIEKSLSIDNIFIFAVIFSSFRVPAAYQHRVLFWGILGALVMRGTMIGIGIYLLNRIHWVIYVFGGFLVLTGVRLALRPEHVIELEDRAAVRLVRRLFPITPGYHGPRFFVAVDGRRHATPLLIVLALIETTDLVFAVDSIPAVFAVTRDPFLVYSSNVFAILGLRALYFLLADVIGRFRYLKFGLAIILVYVGIKMLVSEVLEIPAFVSLGIIALVLTVSILLSLRGEPRPTE